MIINRRPLCRHFILFLKKDLPLHERKVLDLTYIISPASSESGLQLTVFYILL